MKVETVVIHVYGDHGRAVVYFSSRPGNVWAIELTIGGGTTHKIENDKKRDALRPCPTHAIQILRLHLARAEAARPKLTVLR